MQIYRTVVGNTDPSLVIACERNGVAVDLTNAQGVELIIKDENTGVTTNTGHQSCTVNSPATAGIVTYSPVTTDFPSEARYVGDIKITYNASRFEHIRELLLVIVRDQ